MILDGIFMNHKIENQRAEANKTKELQTEAHQYSRPISSIKGWETDFVLQQAECEGQFVSRRWLRRCLCRGSERISTIRLKFQPLIEVTLFY
jgi:hypothetical protein